MADRSLTERKLEASRELAAELLNAGGSFVAAYWEWSDDVDRWTFYLVPESTEDDVALIRQAAPFMREPRYRSVFSIADVVVDGRQIDRARALGAYIRSPHDVGRRLDTTFAGGQYFQSVILVYVAPELKAKHFAA